MPRAHPREFREHAVELVRDPKREISIAQLAENLGISDSCLRNWVNQADIDEGRRDGMTSSEREELTRLRKENRRLKMEREILSRAAAFFAKENVLPPQ